MKAVVPQIQYITSIVISSCPHIYCVRIAAYIPGPKVIGRSRRLGELCCIQVRVLCKILPAPYGGHNVHREGLPGKCTPYTPLHSLRQKNPLIESSGVLAPCLLLGEAHKTWRPSTLHLAFWICELPITVIIRVLKELLPSTDITPQQSQVVRNQRFDTQAIVVTLHPFPVSPSICHRSFARREQSCLCPWSHYPL